MNYVPKIDRRSFVIGTAAAGAGFTLGMSLPFGAAQAQGTPELNAWVVVRPDDTVVIRFARSEMGQGALTGLCQLVAEELECDWSKVTLGIRRTRRRTSRASASGATSIPPAAMRSASRTNMCAKAARRRGRC